MDRSSAQFKDCIVTLQEENSPCIQSNKQELENPFLISQQYQKQYPLPFNSPDLLMQSYQLDQLKLQSVLFNQLMNVPDEHRMSLEMLQHQLLQQQLLYNAACLNQMQTMNDLNVQNDTRDYSDSKIKRKHIKKSHNPQFNTGHWSAQEHQMYVNFLQQHKDVMESPELKKTNKIFKLMSDIIKSRSPSQCRSHHQKFNPFSKSVQSTHVIRRKMKAEQTSNQQSNDDKHPAAPKQEPFIKIEPVQEFDIPIEDEMLQLQDPPMKEGSDSLA